MKRHRLTVHELAEVRGKCHALDEVAELLEVHRVQLHPELDPVLDGSRADCARCVELVERLVVLAGEIAEYGGRE